MSFSDHKITAFTHRITDLPDQPNLPADELKERFDSSPEELRESVNGICDDADRLEERVSGIIAETFGDSIDKSMLSDELQTELDAKATQTALAAEAAAREAADTAETTAREDADDALSTRLTTVEDSLPEKCEIFTGTYTGNWSGSNSDPSTRTITLGFQPKAVIVASNTTNGTSYSTPSVHVALPNVPSSWITITATGFTAGKYMNWSANGTYRYIAFK